MFSIDLATHFVSKKAFNIICETIVWIYISLSISIQFIPKLLPLLDKKLNEENMKISIIGGGNMGGAIALGLADSKSVLPQDITVIGRSDKTLARLADANKYLNTVAGDYDSLSEADIVIVAVKPWLVEEVLKTHRDKLLSENQLLVSVAAGITLDQLQGWTTMEKPLFRLIPNTAIAIRQSMTFVASRNAGIEQENMILQLFSNLGKVELIDEKQFSAATSLSSCGIAYAFRYIRAAMEGGVEMGLYPNQSRDIVLQTLRGAIDLIEANNSHPEAEIDKVTTPGGITIKGLNEMEHAGFTSSVIRGLKASNVK